METRFTFRCGQRNLLPLGEKSEPSCLFTALLFLPCLSCPRPGLTQCVLESWLDYTGELEPPEPLARLPQLKHCIKQLLTDLGKVQQIALCCST
ncbi:PHD finger protein 20 [Pteropus alecto]|uniref:PHD finger protein 20 n=1 Tax=Pteropus alecto TaxID=9402 RepID=L5JXU2_PTEAL|nr:PHD finger protein 20 [Pteropus alecto]